jgi:SPP1 gp7 family putative phage head morphogenesis protein
VSYQDLIASVETLTNTVNGRLVDNSIRHGLYMLRYQAAAYREVLKFLDAGVIPRLMADVSNRLISVEEKYGIGAWSLKRAQERLAQVFAAYRSGIASANGVLSQEMKAIALLEAAWQRKSLERAVGPKFIFAFQTPSVQALERIIETHPFQGYTMGQWYEDLGKSQVNELNQIIRRGFVAGDPAAHIIREIRETIPSEARRHAKTLARSGFAMIRSEARQALYDANSEVIWGWQFVATLDDRTTDICISLDGQQFKLGEGPRPPLHHQCRSDDPPVIKTWKELGLDKYGLKDMTPGERAAFGGPVKGKVDYKQWIMNQGLHEKQLAFGKRWGEAIHKGEATVEDYLRRKTGQLPKVA